MIDNTSGPRWGGCENGKAPVSLLKKLLEVRRRSGYVQKDGKNTAQKYSYVSERAFIEEVRSHLNDLSVFVFGSLVSGDTQKIEKSGGGGSFLHTAQIDFTFADVDSGEWLTVRYEGQGYDSSDKASNKALTGALKYVLRQTFLIPTGDDPEVENEVDRPVHNGNDEKKALIAQLKDVHQRVAKGGGEIAALPSDEELYKKSPQVIKTSIERLTARLAERN